MRGVLNGKPVPNGLIVEFPTVAALGNDDRQTDDEENNPYKAFTDTNRLALIHSVGEVVSEDTPTLLLLNVDPPIPGTNPPLHATIHMELDFQEFVRLCIGDGWYEVSDPLPWSLSLNATLSKGAWLSTP